MSTTGAALAAYNFVAFPDHQVRITDTLAKLGLRFSQSRYTSRLFLAKKPGGRDSNATRQTSQSDAKYVRFIQPSITRRG